MSCVYQLSLSNATGWINGSVPDNNQIGGTPLVKEPNEYDDIEDEKTYVTMSYEWWTTNYELLIMNYKLIQKGIFKLKIERTTLNIPR